MKYIYVNTCKILLSIGMMIVFFSCADYLDVDKYFDDRMTEKKLFESKDYSERWLAGVYTHLSIAQNLDVASKGMAPHNFSDDMYFGDRNGLYRRLNNGMYDEGTFQDSWRECYIGIRDASTFIRNIDVNIELSESKIADMKAQARFLRAYYYWLLLRKYGPIPIIPNEGEIGYTADYENLSISRSSYDECVDYIVSELELAAHDLDSARTSREVTCPTRGAALAARAKVLLYAASPLVNGNTEMADLTDDTGRLLISQQYDELKWAKAAAAAKDVIDLGLYKLYVAPRKYDDNGGRSYPQTIMPPLTSDNAEYMNNDWPLGWKNIDPFESYRSLFNGDVQIYGNEELIFSRGMNQFSESLVVMMQHQMPYQMGGYNCHGMTWKQSEAYYMNDGKDMLGKDSYLNKGDGSTYVTGYVTESNKDQYKPLPIGVSLQYADREPRFYASVAYNGSIWDMISSEKEDKRYYQAWYYHGSENGKLAQAPQLYLATGIGVKKYYNPIDSYQAGGRRVDKPEPAIRYAEILLIYAEALNELTSTHEVKSWNGSKTHSVNRDIAQMILGIEPIRIRAGLPNFKQEIYNDVDLFRQALKRERQIELFAEGHRYFDLRRWKDAPDELAIPMYGCNTNIGENMRDQYYVPTVISSMPTVFVKKMYFWPISHSELKKNKRLTQNPGWKYYD